VVGRKYRRIHRETADLRERHSDVTIWEFRDDCLRYKDVYFDITLKCEAFNGYWLRKGNLFLVLTDSVDQCYILSETEIGTVEFARVITFLRGKMRPLPDQFQVEITARGCGFMIESARNFAGRGR
jgi:hypothetical protein